MEWLLYVGCGSIVWALFCGWVASKKGRDPRLAAVMGFLFGPIAVVVYAVLPTTAEGRIQNAIEGDISRDLVYKNEVKNCPQCGRQVGFTSRFCPRCEYRFPPDKEQAPLPG